MEQLGGAVTLARKGKESESDTDQTKGSNASTNTSAPKNSGNKTQ